MDFFVYLTCSKEGENDIIKGKPFKYSQAADEAGSKARFSDLLNLYSSLRWKKEAL
jgi:hypothetical protein